MLSLLRAPLVQKVVLSLYAACPIFILTMGHLMTARFTALTGHPPDVSNYASSAIRSEITFCEGDRWFAFFAAAFRSEIRYGLVCSALILSLVALLTLSAFVKQKRFAAGLSALLVAYCLLFATPAFLMPLSRYYLIQIGD